MGGLNDVGRDDNVLVDEFGAQRVVGNDTADLRSGVKHHLRLGLCKPRVHCRLIAQIDLASRHCNNCDILARKTPHQRTADHPAMTRDKDGLSFQVEGCGGHLKSHIPQNETGRP